MSDPACTHRPLNPPAPAAAQGASVASTPGGSDPGGGDPKQVLMLMIIFVICGSGAGAGIYVIMNPTSVMWWVTCARLSRL